MKKINKLKGLMNSNEIEPFIRHIRFPFFKNLSEGCKIEFSFPVTALVGQNGTNKSSVLRALFGSPNNYSLGSLWFSTDVDEIKDDGRSRFIYGYYDATSKKIVEVIKTRISKGNDPDYWEPSRPLKSDGMEPMPHEFSSPNQLKTRWKAIEKNVIYLDFRATISAFDKFFYHSDFHKYPKKDHLRKKSQMIREIIDNNLKSYKPYKGKKEKLITNKILEQSKVDAISTILGRKYKSIRLIEHSLFTNDTAPTVILESASINYSEAFAGSGEFAVTMLVHKLLDAPKASLILLDEPEVSLHPSAQCKLMDFIFNQALVNKHQIIISTHSSSIVQDLPNEALKLFCLNDKIGKVDVLENVSPEESFFILGDRLVKKTIIVEDKLAKKFVEKSLRSGGEALLGAFDVQYCPGGAGSIINSIAVPLFLANVRNAIFLLDGDKITNEEFIRSNAIAQDKDTELPSIVKKILGQDVKIPCNGSNGTSDKDNKIKLYREFIDYIFDSVSYLPIKNPETYIIENPMGDYSHYKEKVIQDIDNPKEIIEEICKLDTGEQRVNSEDIYETQIRMLNKIPDTAPEITRTKELLQSYLKNDTIRT